MKDVVELLRYLNVNYELDEFLDALDQCDSARNNLIFRELVGRIRRAAGMPKHVPPPQARGQLLDLLDGD